MRTWFIFSFVIAGLLLPSSVSCCQQLNDKELKIYYEYVEKSEALYADESLENEEDAEKAFHKIEKELMDKHNISYEHLKDICDRAWKCGITPHEQEILNEERARLSALVEPPVGSPSSEWEKLGNAKERITQEVAEKYGISCDVLWVIGKRAKRFAKEQMKK